MDIVTTIPVRLNGPESVVPFLEEVRQRIAHRAYENFVRRGSVDGYDLDDWFEAERELIIKPAAAVRMEGNDVLVEVILPDLELPNLAVHTAPRQLVISSDADQDGLQLCQVIDLPNEISLESVGAEQLHDTLQITAVVANPQPEPQLQPV
jgi:HSP20 family molecular chaperone IbpA